MRFKVGQSATYDNMQGYVRFVSEYYITIQIKEPDPWDCSVLVFPHDFDKVEVDESVPLKTFQCILCHSSSDG